VEVVFDGTNGYFYVSGNLIGSFGSSDTFAITTSLFGQSAQHGDPFYGWQGGQLGCPSALSTADRQWIEGCLAWQWDGGTAGTLVGQLPSNHPYKTARPAVTTGGGSTTATLAATESPDVASISASSKTVATLNATETADAAAVSASVKTSANLAATETADTASFAAQAATNTALAASEPSDTAAVTATTATSGALAATEAPDTASLSAGAAISGSLAATEAADAAAVAGQTSTQAAL